jgi:hypothetical protein
VVSPVGRHADRRLGHRRQPGHPRRRTLRRPEQLRDLRVQPGHQDVIQRDHERGQVLLGQSDFVGSDADSTDNYLLVDEADISEADYVESGSVGAQDLYTHGAVGAFQVETVCVHSIAAKTQPGVREFSHLLNSGANTGVGASTALTVTAAHYATIFELEPDTSNSWTPTLFDATESGYEVTV